MQKSPADDFSVGRGCDFVPPRLFSEGLDPVGDFLLRDGGGEALALLPVAGAGERRELRAALADAAAGGGAEGNDRLAGEVIGLDERVHRPRGDAPPDRVADVDGVIVGPVICGRGLERHVAQGLVVMLARDAAVGVVVVQVGARVRLGRFELQQIAARRGGDGLGRGLRAAGRGEIDDERLAAGSGGGRGGLGRCGPAAAGGEAQQHDCAGQHGDELFHGDASSVVDGRDPAVNGLVRRAQGRVVEVHVEARFHVRARAQRRHVLERAAKPAAVRGEGVDGLATEVVRGQERARGRGAGVPPDGRAEHDRIVAVKVDVHRLELRQEAALDLLLALRDHIVI